MKKIFGRYLNILGIREEKPSLEALTRIVRAHVTTVPFENVSKLYYMRTERKKGVPELERFLDGIERFHFGGTCYANAYYLHELLVSLRYDADLCGADMQNPDVHIVNIARIEGREYLVDVGYGAPFLAPLPRDLSTDFTLHWGAERYVLSPRDNRGRSRMTFSIDGLARQSYLLNPKARRFGHFKHVIADSFGPEATFMNSIVIIRYGKNSSKVLRNRTYTEFDGTNLLVKNLETAGEVIESIEKKFKIPSSLARVALDGLSI